nr:hypothetical protein Iba_chr03fCG2330 [Ipomoea batatas]
MWYYGATGEGGRPSSPAILGLPTRVGLTDRPPRLMASPARPTHEKGSSLWFLFFVCPLSPKHGGWVLYFQSRATLEASVDEDDLPKLLAVLLEYVPDTGPTPFSEVTEQASGPAVEACTEQATGPTQEQVRGGHFAPAALRSKDRSSRAPCSQGPKSVQTRHLAPEVSTLLSPNRGLRTD